VKLPQSFRIWCEGIATEKRLSLSLKAFDPLPALKLAESMGATICTPQDVKTLPAEVKAHLLSPNAEWSAVTASLAPFIIIYNPLHSPGRQEADLMHELAHFILKHPLIHFDELSGLPLRDAGLEDEASYLGSCLQIPRRALAWAIQKGMTKPQIAAYFGASLQMVNFRVNMTGLKLPGEQG
jgi:hypothetical protein